MSTPRSPTARAARIGAIGNGMCHTVVISDSSSADAPTRVYWTKEICPTYPVTTTNDSAMIARMNEVISAAR